MLSSLALLITIRSMIRSMLVRSGMIRGISREPLRKHGGAGHFGWLPIFTPKRRK